MKYTPSTESIPQSSRRAVNEKLLYLIDNNCCEAYGITKQDVFQGYTGDGGLHGLSRKNYRSYHTYSEAKKELEIIIGLPFPNLKKDTLITFI